MSAELPVPLVTRPWWSGRKSAFVAVAVTVYGFALWQTGTNPRAFIEGFPNLVRFVAGMFPPDFSSISHLLGRVVETIRIAVMGTALATAGAFFLAPLAARNISPSPLLYQASRFVCDVFRGISELVWAITFVAMVGLGPFSGVLALAVHSTGALGKYFSEAIEAIDLGIIEATTSTGARRIQVFLHGIFPELRTLFANYTLYYFEHNLRQATVLGIVGAGGIGLELLLSLQYYKYHTVLTIVLLMLLLVVTGDRASAIIRKRLLGGEIVQVR